MKKLWTFLLFVPVFSFGQRFEISEMAGYSNPSYSNMSLTVGYRYNPPYYSHPPVNFNAGFSNHFSINYFLIKRLSIGAFYELNFWNPNNSSYGLATDVHFKFLYFGANISTLYIKNANYTFTDVSYHASSSIQYNAPSVAYGLHAGLSQKLTGRISLKMQAGYNTSSVKGSTNDPYLFQLGPGQNPNSQVSVLLHYYYLLAGISYQL
jgi:hypothetical protein